MSYYDLKEPKVDIPLDWGGIKEIETYSLLEILQPRAEEIFSFLHEEIVQNRLNCFMPSGLVITGGGSLLSGLQQLVHSCFRCQCALVRHVTILVHRQMGANTRCPKRCDHQNMRPHMDCLHCLRAKANLTSQWRGHAVIGKSISSYENMDL